VTVYAALVTGTRHRSHPDVERWLDALVKRRGPPAFVFVGDADGVDHQVRLWCKRTGIVAMVGTAAWEGAGDAAGPQRNNAMACLTSVMSKLFEPSTVLAFPCPKSRGTWQCVAEAKKLGLECHVNESLIKNGLGDL
jgi:hypothetical protein